MLLVFVCQIIALNVRSIMVARIQFLFCYLASFERMLFECSGS